MAWVWLKLGLWKEEKDTGRDEAERGRLLSVLRRSRQHQGEPDSKAAKERREDQCGGYCKGRGWGDKHAFNKIKRLNVPSSRHSAWWKVVGRKVGEGSGNISGQGGFLTPLCPVDWELRRCFLHSKRPRRLQGQQSKLMKKDVETRGQAFSDESLLVFTQMSRLPHASLTPFNGQNVCVPSAPLIPVLKP